MFVKRKERKGDRRDKRTDDQGSDSHLPAKNPKRTETKAPRRAGGPEPSVEGSGRPGSSLQNKKGAGSCQPLEQDPGATKRL